VPEVIDEGYRKLAAFDLQQYREAQENLRNYSPKAGFNRSLAAGAEYLNLPAFKQE